MNRTTQVLAGALAVQVALGAMTWSGRSTPEPTALHPLVTFDPATVTAVSITGRTTPGAPATPVQLEKDGDTWVIASSHRYPADPAKVTDLLDKLDDLQVRDAIATTTASFKELEVADDTFSRSVTITSAAGPTTLLLGGAGGTSMHVRLPGTNEAFSVRGTSAFAIADSDRRFWKPEIVAVQPDDLATWTISNPQGTRTLVRSAGAWSMPDLPPGHTVVSQEVDALARMLLTVRINEVVGQGDDPAWGLDGSTHVTWTRTVDGTTVTEGYVVGALVDNKRAVRVDGSPWVVRVAASSISRAVETSFDFVDDGQPDFMGQIGGGPPR